MYNEATFESIVRSYTDELDANLYIEYILHKHLLKDEFDVLGEFSPSQILSKQVSI